MSTPTTRDEIANLLAGIRQLTTEKGSDVLYAIVTEVLEESARERRARRYPAIGAATDGGLLAERDAKGGAK